MSLGNHTKSPDFLTIGNATQQLVTLSSSNVPNANFEVM